ncbi:CG3434 [Drosophila busckii]|uniref:Queuine tRNA-ribosyltransferase accessory subunit 2 n=1 Tax=Drosophila busckii TaxID=30019 RepID=A0A0M5J804_DROBS|nr:queuine tRNA-ribosyltransferase accessory subunit 2 [Drosophila busckii]ALC43411.1 CG3434 [Drosophila busckii]
MHCHPVLFQMNKVNMKFVIKNIAKSSGRLGQLRIKEDVELSTPLLMQTTKGGSIPYLSAEVFEMLLKQQQQQQFLLQLTLCSMDQMAESLGQWSRSLCDYVGYPGQSTLLLLRDPCEATPTGGNDRDVVPMFTRRGKEALTAKRYMEMVAQFRPDVYQGMCDADTHPESTKKRVQKSVDRTEKFMEECYAEQAGKQESFSQCTMLAPLVGGYSTYARTQSIQHARKQPSESYGGYIFEGFHTNGLAATNLKSEQLLPIVEHCMQQLETDKPRFMPGAFTPPLTLELIRLGADVFDTSYAYLAAANYKALTFNYDKDAVPAVQAVFLDVTDDELKEQFTPLLSNCSCLACRQHTRAYLHHLYKTHELLGPILLMMHNLHHYLGFFEVIRTQLAQDELPQLLALLTSQGSYSIQPNTKVIAKAAMGKGFSSNAA